MAFTKEQRQAQMKKAREARKARLQGKGVAVATVTEEPARSVELPKRATTPWKPARVLDIPEDMKDPRFTYRWVNTKKEGNDLKKSQEGWDFDRELQRKLMQRFELPRTIEDGAPTGSMTQMRELILMRMPKEMAQERNEYYRRRGQVNLRRNLADMENRIGESGGDGRAQVYGSYEESRGT